jgi:HSP20 family protein
VTVFAKKSELVICLDLPGVPRESINVSATPLLVTVTGKRPAGFEEPETRLASAEAPYGAFRRDVALPPDLFLSDLTATLKDGVLELRVPRATKPAAKPITIQ